MKRHLSAAAGTSTLLFGGMTIGAAEREALVRFFAEARRPLALGEAAALLGWTREQVEARATGDRALEGELVSWDEVAFLLLETWPRALLLEALGAGTAALPRELHLQPVQWELPIYVVRAVEQQFLLHRWANAEARDLTLQDYVAWLLHLAIEEETVTAMRGDRGFVEAYEFPAESRGEAD
ncbi:MAG TPA: hypothetical protein VEK57_23710 [Thermoanaerobaculia bacterium]|nr:hypothetical protein [Thermoanaerobaculia bacterium]